MKRLRLGLIGTGTIAQSAHLPAIAYLRDEYELVAVADVRADVAEQVGRRWGAKAWYSDYRHLLERDDIDVVDICTPEFLHAEQTVAAAEAGKHILCEKPMANAVAEADAMIAAVIKANVRLMIAHSRRFTARYREIRAALDRGEIGQVRMVRENERRPRAMYSSLGADWSGYWSPEGSDREWRSLARYSQGTALTGAVHEMDLARWFVGDDAESVYAESRITDPQGETPDFLTYTVRFRNGAVAAAEIASHLTPGYPYFHMMELFGTDGTIRATDPPMSPLEVWSGGAMRFPANFGQLLHVDDAYIRELKTFAEYVNDGTKPTLTVWDARQALALSLAVVESSKTGQVVSLPQETPPGGAL